MEAVMRRPYQGVLNIIRFNWHFYVIATASVFLLLLIGNLLGALMFWTCMVLATGIMLSTGISLFASHYIYDQSGLYDFTWLEQFNKLTTRNVVNIHAGFDEASSTLKRHLPDAALHIFDFYDPSKHTEISIERARKAYPPYHGTIKIATSGLPVTKQSVDIIFNVFALHEVRSREERIHFLKEQVSALRQDGKVVVVEHLRDLPNFLAYNIGFFHFLSGQEWRSNFEQAGLFIDNEFKITPFINVYILTKADGNTP